MNEFDAKLQELSSKVLKKRVKEIQQQLAKEFDFNGKVAEVFSEKIAEAVQKILADIFISLPTRTELEQIRQALREPVELKDFHRLIPSGEITVKNLDKIQFPKQKEFPKKIEAEILKAVNTLEIEPTETLIRNDVNDNPVEIKETYDRFIVTTTIIRNPTGSVRLITQKVTGR